MEQDRLGLSQDSFRLHKKEILETLVDLVSYYQGELNDIRAQNPRALWPRLISDYYNAKIATLSSSPEYWQGYSESLNSMRGDPTANMRAAIALLPRSCRWRVSESRQGANRTTIYVIVDYTSIQQSADVETVLSGATARRSLRQTILQFVLVGNPQLVARVMRVEKGDVFWPIPSLSFDEASQLAIPVMLDRKLRPRIAPPIDRTTDTDGSEWLVINLPTYQGPLVGEFENLLRKHGFKPKPFEIQEGWGANKGYVLPPESWKNYRAASGVFFLDEHFESNISDLQQNGDTAAAKISIKRTGCNLVCEFVREYWTSTIGKRMTEEGCCDDPFFFTYWDEGGGSGYQSGYWPEQATRLIYYRWLPRIGWTVVKDEPMR